MACNPTESSNIAVLVSHSGETQSSSWTHLLVVDPVTGSTLDKREAEGVDGRSLALVGTPAGDLYFITSSVTSRITLFPTSRSSSSVYSTQCPVRCLASSSDGIYYAAGVKEKIHLWEGGSGGLVAVISHHYQSVSALTFSPDGSYLVSGGEDGIILVWRLPLLISSAYTQQFSLLTVPQSTQHEWSEDRAKWTLTEHALPVTSLLCGLGGVRGLLFSAAVDHTCRIWDLLRGVCLYTIAMTGVPTCLATDPMETLLLIGQKHGEVRKVRITFTPPQTVASLDRAEHSLHNATTMSHQTEVTALIALRDNTHFLSGDLSGIIITWHTESLQPLKRTDLHNPVTALLLLPLAVSRSYSTQEGRGKMLTATGFKPPPPGRRTGGSGEQGVCLLRMLQDLPIEDECVQREELEKQSNESQEFMDTKLANNENFKKLTTCLDDMLKQAIDSDFNY